MSNTDTPDDEAEFTGADFSRRTDVIGLVRRSLESTDTDTDALVRKLRYMGRQYAAGQVSRGGSPRKHYLEEAADTIERLTRENAALKTVMVAAAEEIHAHRQAHCDADGYGPQNLMRRLEEGIPSEYGYTAGAFAELKRERDEAQQVCAEAYQVVGVLLDDTGQFDTEHGTKILDNLSEHRPVHDDVLPWSPADTIECDAIEAAVARERERCAKLCESARPAGGRAWSSEQSACFEALTHVAAAIRTTKATT